MKAFVEKNKHNMCLAKASAKKFMCLYKKMSVLMYSVTGLDHHHLT